MGNNITINTHSFIRLYCGVSINGFEITKEFSTRAKYNLWRDEGWIVIGIYYKRYKLQ